MENQSFWYLENIDVTVLLCPQKIARVEMDNHPHKAYPKGTYIYLPKEHANHIYFVTDGSVKIGTYGDGGKEITKTILGKGEVFGELSLIGEKVRRDFAYTLEDTCVCLLSIDEMKSLMREHSALNLFMMKIMGSRVLEMEKRLESLVFKDSRSRVINYLEELAQKKGQRVGFETLVRKFLTHQEIANLTATSRQTVTTVLNELRNKNILTFNRSRLLIRDLEKLKQESLV